MANTMDGILRLVEEYANWRVKVVPSGDGLAEGESARRWAAIEAAVRDLSDDCAAWSKHAEEMEAERDVLRRERDEARRLAEGWRDNFYGPAPATVDWNKVLPWEAAPAEQPETPK